MARRLRRGIVALALGASVALFVVSALPPGSATARSTANEWTGTWETDWGRMTLTQAGTNVTGTYTHDQGRIVGTASGLVLTGTWNEAPSRAGPTDAGSFRWTMKPDLRSFSGSWEYEGGGGGTWSATRVGTPPFAWPALPDAKVPLADVSNGCGPAATSGAPSDPRWGDTSTYFDRTTKKGKYEVKFRVACDLHDAGYTGAKVTDSINGGATVDYWSWSRDKVDDKFLKDMRTLCDRSLVSAPIARAKCMGRGGLGSFGALSRYNAVTTLGWWAWWKRLELSGAWDNRDDPSEPGLTILQKARYVRAVWRDGSAAPGLRGEFRGTLISLRAGDTIVKGYAKVTDSAGSTTLTNMTLSIAGKTRNTMVVSGPPSISGTMVRG